ncbi:type I restriction enzyme, R subunit [Thermomonospora echinospora]|uniref:Type I restriction enzyme, R subunit n=1 Tax=Thermomonospora echinospora TaxID=1992 RepID=A0A1H5YKI9_9ACTN|nr:DEAD/DEAH box helicase family protein [Thermomonospora echinospora]SEG23896.1 type I restriction enzyme, R subunit [Thermomonospora echinospora]
MAEPIDELAKRSRNFGFLLRHEPLLVMDGAAAESYLYSDPDAALAKARRFTETLAKMLVKRTQTRVRGTTQDARIAALTDAGVLVPSIRQAFDHVRISGNRAVHSHWGDVRAALSCVRTCFELGVWFHRAVTGEGAPQGFVPPPDPAARASETSAERAELEELRRELTRHRERLTEVMVHRDGQLSRLEAEARARRQAEQELVRVQTARDELRALVEQTDRRLKEAQARFAAELERAQKVKPAHRDAFIARAQRAAGEPLTEAEVRTRVDEMLRLAGWAVQDADAVNLFAADGVAVREVATADGVADYLLYVDQKLVGVIEAKREGTILSPVEAQSARYADSLTASQQFAAWRIPLPFRYETTAVETHFTNTLDPAPRARRVFSFHQPRTLSRWMRDADGEPDAPTLRARLRGLPPLDTRGLRAAQVRAITGLETSLARDEPRGLIQMATGAGKTYMAVTQIYRLLRYAKARRVLFLVDRNNLGKQAYTEFDNFVTPDDGRKFTDLYNVERLGAAAMKDSTKVVISTVQRLHARLRGEPVDPDVEDEAFDSYATSDVVEVDYSADLPPETFDLIIVDECHRSIYGVWRQVLEYFDAYLVGLTATPVKQTFGFFHQNLVSEYTYRESVADAVNVDFDVYRIRTEHAESGATIDRGTIVPIMSRPTRRKRYEELDDDLTWTGSQLGRKVISTGQLRLVLQTFRDRLFTEIFPGRTYVPKTLIFAVDDNHAQEIVEMTRTVFGKGNDFCQKITYKAADPDALIAAFRNSPDLRIAVTVNMIATGTDIRPLECVFFLNEVKSWALFEQMKGRGARTVDPAELRQVTPDTDAKTRFVLVDAVGVTDSPRVDATPLVQHSDRQVSLEALLNKAGNLTISPDEASTLAGRLARLNKQITPDERAELENLAGRPLAEVIASVSSCADPDALQKAHEAGGKNAVHDLVVRAVRPLAENRELRRRLLEIRRAHDVYWDEVNPDTLIEAAAQDPKLRAQEVVTSWRAYLDEHRDEITTIEVAYRSGESGRTAYAKLKELAARIARPPHEWTPAELWKAYERLGLAADKSGTGHGPIDLIGLIRFELGLDSQPTPHRAVVEERYAAWLARQRQAGVVFTADQRWWLDHIRDVVITHAAIDHTELDKPPFTDRGGIDGFLHAFGDADAETLLSDLNRNLTA